MRLGDAAGQGSLHAPDPAADLQQPGLRPEQPPAIHDLDQLRDGRLEHLGAPQGVERDAALLVLLHRPVEEPLCEGDALLDRRRRGRAVDAAPQHAGDARAAVAVLRQQRGQLGVAVADGGDRPHVLAGDEHAHQRHRPGDGVGRVRGGDGAQLGVDIADIAEIAPISDSLDITDIAEVIGGAQRARWRCFGLAHGSQPRRRSVAMSSRRRRSPMSLR
ncbi:MAG: hypothetical protein WKG00_15450 [Polyangiaceae bacterium]